MDAGLLTLPLLGLGLGMLHAFDADHVLAVAGVAAQEKEHTHSQVARLSMRWGIGHAGTLLVLAFLSLVLGYYLPPELSSAAEMLVGVVIVALGVSVLAQAWLQKQLVKRNKYYALVIGAIHGLAGSASVLAALSVQTAGNAWLGMFYVLLFGVGVASSMCLCSLSFLQLSKKINLPFIKQEIVMVLIGLVSVLFGVYWLHSL